MAIKIAKRSVKSEVQCSEPPKEKSLQECSLEELADRYGAAHDAVTALMLSPKIVQFEQVKAELLDRLKVSLQPEDSAELTGSHWVLEIGPARRNASRLKDGAIPVIRAMLGEETFHNIASVSIANCNKYLTPAQLDQVLDTGTGYSSSRIISPSYLG